MQCKEFYGVLLGVKDHSITQVKGTLCYDGKSATEAGTCEFVSGDPIGRGIHELRLGNMKHVIVDINAADGRMCDFVIEGEWI